MPLYEYEYLAADGSGTGRTFETFQNYHDPHLTHCPDTGQPCRRVITAPANGNLVFTESGGESRMHYFHPDEVQDFRRELRTNCIKDDGRVIFADRQEQKAFQKAYDAYEARTNSTPKRKRAIFDPKKNKRS